MFDFITGGDFRLGLESDYRELSEAVTSSCWKTVHVLAGSIIEAVLIDYLVASDYKSKAGKDPLRLDLSQAITACLADKVISQKTADLANVVREYRNLIHPGRVVRLGELVDEDSATIARALVGVVVSELAANKRATYGYTAEQIVTKIEKDPSATSLLGHLFKQTNKTELGRLLLSILPDRYMALLKEGGASSNSDVLEALSNTFRQAFGVVDNDVRRDVMLRYISFLKEESGPFILCYENAFLLADDLQWLPDSDVPLARQRLLSRLSKETEPNVLRIIKGGLARTLEKRDVNMFVDPLVKAATVKKDTLTRALARDVLDDYIGETSSRQDHCER